MENTKQYDLEDRALLFAKTVNNYVCRLPKTIPNLENGKQLVRATGSVGANYIEANESLGKKDFMMRIKISRKESKESRFWLNLTNPYRQDEPLKLKLIQEATELMNIFGAIYRKCL